ncbi:MAG: tRNA lysidine(34) synthetase TilS, partial [Bacilli bacterium]|nr:tRNA lysidine(34) synthetase TilS [Bacilli bacterium]
MNLDKKKKYVVACSFGPDSMALLDMMKKENYNIVVAHVNYHKRKESDFEEQSLKKYCELNNLECFVLDTSSLKVTGNFQEWARKVRYEFFKKVLLENKCDAVVVAHQEDDLIETYLMQKSKKSFVAYYGIEKETVLFGVRIIR